LIEVLVIGGGPTGLIAAEIAARAGNRVHVVERMNGLGRKFLMAGRGGLNLTHSEDLPRFLERYGAAREFIEPLITRFPPVKLRAWCEALGQETFVGSSGRVFPRAMKASPLLRAWIARLDRLGVSYALRRNWIGWNDLGQPVLADADGRHEFVTPRATILALGGASWPRLGSDGAWTDVLTARGVRINPLAPANCGIALAWTPYLRDRHHGAPLKRIALSFEGHRVSGEAIVTRRGLEGGAVYALVAVLRGALRRGQATLHIDLRPDLSHEELARRLAAPRRRLSLANFLRRTASLAPAAIALLHESGEALPSSPPRLAERIKSLPLTVTGLAGLERAISTAGGIALDELDEQFMLRRLPGVFAAGEMLDWEAPTGGYLLQACFATGVAAAEGALGWLASAARS
jgi:uncharacterized flavoprotein (TIGR03862 family)